MTTKNCCGSPETMSSESCGCCEGVERLTPRSTANRPGLSELAYRIGTHAEFLETMQARLSSYDFPELAGLTTRDGSDPSLALLDAWAAVADVLTFYQERIANEGYLRTADERRSILELGRLVGYKMRPGVSASAFLAYTIDENTREEVTIPAGSRVQSIPGPDELPQTFESSEDLKVRSGWNNLRPRMTQPQTVATILGIVNSPTLVQGPRVYLKGINTNLKPNDRLLIDFDVYETGGMKLPPELHTIKEVKPDAKADHTLVIFMPEQQQSTEWTALRAASVESSMKDPTVSLIQDLTLRPSQQPANQLRMWRELKKQFIEKTDTGYRILTSTVPKLRTTLTTAIANANIANPSKIKVFALRTRASLFGHNASKKPKYKTLETGTPRIIAALTAGQLEPQSEWDEWEPWKIDEPDGESKNILYLDRAYDNILQDNYIALVRESGGSRNF